MRVLCEIDRFLKLAGHAVAGICCVLAALIILLSLIASSLFAAMAVGLYFSHQLGLDNFSILAMGIAIGLFFAVYVWEPHVKIRVVAVFKAILSRNGLK